MTMPCPFLNRTNIDTSSAALHKLDQFDAVGAYAVHALSGKQTKWELYLELQLSAEMSFCGFTQGLVPHLSSRSSHSYLIGNSLN
jgi:hypothetical protein